MSRIKSGLSGLSALELIAKAQHIVTQMTGNPTFAAPIPALASVTTAANELSTAIDDAETGDHLEVLIKDAKYTALANLLRQLALYVGNVANGNTLIIESSGFEVASPPSPVGSLPAAQNVQAKNTGFPGMVKVTWDAVPKARGYIAEMTTTDPNSPATVWAEKGHPTSARIEVDGLTPGQNYWFRVIAIGSAGLGEPSDPAAVMAT